MCLCAMSRLYVFDMSQLCVCDMSRQCVCDMSRLCVCDMSVFLFPRAAPLMLLALEQAQAAMEVGAEEVGSGGFGGWEVDLLVGVSGSMRNSTYFLGVAAGIDRLS